MTDHNDPSPARAALRRCQDTTAYSNAAVPGVLPYRACDRTVLPGDEDCEDLTGIMRSDWEKLRHGAFVLIVHQPGGPIYTMRELQPRADVATSVAMSMTRGTISADNPLRWHPEGQGPDEAASLLTRETFNTIVGRLNERDEVEKFILIWYCEGDAESHIDIKGYSTEGVTCFPNWGDGSCETAWEEVVEFLTDEIRWELLLN